MGNVTTSDMSPRRSLTVMNTVTIESRTTTALRTTIILVGGYLAVSVLTLVVEDAPAEALAAAIRRVMRGEHVIDPALAVATLAADDRGWL
jgi:DNA-binding NarL/FixJ family response regulator